MNYTAFMQLAMLGILAIARSLGRPCHMVQTFGLCLHCSHSLCMLQESLAQQERMLTTGFEELDADCYWSSLASGKLKCVLHEEKAEMCG